MKTTERAGRTNRLAYEKSPYLLQHAGNPVDWYPWGEEAFAAARLRDKPIFLSIGYATCHWCHVMERESFEDGQIAALLNEAFVCVKVDREERPDIDTIYMTVCQMMTGQGGWPLTIIMTPEKKPFHAATYVPPAQRFGRLGMRELIPRLADAWERQREKVAASSDQIAEIVARRQLGTKGRRLEPEALERGRAELLGQYDREHGGFGARPKFPTPHKLVFLLRQGEAAGVAAAERTLRAMRLGGLFDHVGFGFHRYATDEEWLLPHFEKMLYDQALLALAYVEAFEATRNPFYERVAREVLEYVARDLTAPGGGFYSAEDADSEGEEGLFYLWPTEEVEAIVGDEFDFVAEAWNLRAEGNFRDEATGRLNEKNIPRLTSAPTAAANARLERARRALFAARERRAHPLKDTKVLADWNGLMIAACARAGRVLGVEAFTRAAEAAAAFVLSEMAAPDGRLWHRWRDGHVAVPGQLEDYAFMISGLLELYEATFDLRHLEAALALNEPLGALFSDEAGGGYFMTADDAEELLARPKEVYDGAVPSGNSVQMLNLLKLARLTGRPELEARAEQTGAAFVEAMERAPSNCAQALCALAYAAGESMEIVVVGERGDEVVEAMLEQIRSVYFPGGVVLLKDCASAEKLAALAPFTKELTALGGAPTAYVCRGFACDRPIRSAQELGARLKSKNAMDPSARRRGRGGRPRRHRN